MQLVTLSEEQGHRIEKRLYEKKCQEISVIENQLILSEILQTMPEDTFCSPKSKCPLLLPCSPPSAMSMLCMETLLFVSLLNV